MSPKTAEAEEKVVDLTSYVTKAPTPLQQREPDWIMENTGYDPSSAKTKEEAFRMGSKLTLNVHKYFQTSDENRAATAESRELKAAEAEEREAARLAKAEEREAKEAEREEKRVAREEAKAAKAEAAAEKAASKPEKAAPAKKVAAKATTDAKVPAKVVRRPVKAKAASKDLF